MRITFLGAASEVTGSCFLVETGTVCFLVDCGMFQGGREAYRKNLSALAFGFPVRDIDFVLATHAHLDHSGLLPRLGVLGFRGSIYATPATADLLEVILLDSAYIQEKEAEWENRRHHDRHARRGWERAPLYTVAQAAAVLPQLKTFAYDTEFSPHPSVRVIFRDAGHILGSAIIELWIDQAGTRRKLVFSGDIGQPARPVLRDPALIETADILVVESTYGNRVHKSMVETENELVGALTDTLARGGNVVMPVFAVGRAQEVLFVLTDLVRKGRLPSLNIYVDSPMALAATELTLNHRELLDAETLDLLAWQRTHPDKPHIHLIRDVEESIALNRIDHGAVILAASGMCEAGRIKHHLRHNLSRPECAVVITGFQAAGTLGRRLVDGARWVRIFGEEVVVRANIHTIGGLSAHADRDALQAWLSHFRAPPAQTFVVHGEAATALGFAQHIRNQLGWSGVTVPEYKHSVELA